MDFRTKAVIFFALDALLLALLLFPGDAAGFWGILALLVLLQVWIVYELSREPFVSFEYAYVLVGLLAGISYLIGLVWIGTSIEIEYLGFFLFVAYFVSVIVLLFKSHFKLYFTRTGELISEQKADKGDVQDFRKKDQLNELVQAFEIAPAPKKAPVESAKIKDITIDESDDVDFLAGAETPEEKDDEMFAEVIKVRDALGKPEKADVVEEKIDEMKTNIDSMNDDVKSINDKIRLIAEKAILEDAEKKLEAASAERNGKKDSRDSQVYASQGGEKFHNDRDCLSLRRVSKKDIVIYDDPAQAKKAGLRECGLCRK